jgi:hypothetical protein
VLLDGSRSHVNNGKIISYVWKQISGPQVNLEHPDTAKPYFVAPTVKQDISLEFQLAVTNENGISDSDAISVSIIDIPSSPEQGMTDSIEKLMILSDFRIGNIAYHESKISFPWFSSLDYFID